MKLAIILSILGLALADVCPSDKERECITDVNHPFDICHKAAKAKGKDQPVDIECIKYLYAIDQDCWPCICQIAKDNDFTIKGCPKSSLVKQE